MDLLGLDGVKTAVVAHTAMVTTLCRAGTKLENYNKSAGV